MLHTHGVLQFWQQGEIVLRPCKRIFYLVEDFWVWRSDLWSVGLVVERMCSDRTLHLAYWTVVELQ